MSASDTPLVAARRARLKAWIRDQHAGSRKDFVAAAAARGVQLNPTEVSNLQTGQKSFGEKKAAELESAAGMPTGYLVAALDDPAMMSHAARLDAEIIRAAILLAKRALRLAHDQDLVIERDPEVFAQALLTAMAQRERMEATRRDEPGSGDGKARPVGSAARAPKDGTVTESAARRPRKRA
ncbi:hypothetical protein ABE488_09075 [Luteimonas sp. TWI662]|uniref:hypothetical protein n=1 Tax=Luteimonas sp. TWI662 TaxID=3136789 RepID=UPI00320B877F